MSRDAMLYLKDIVASCEKIQRFLHGLEFGQFIDNELIQDAVIRNIEVIGEAAKSVPISLREQYPQIPWKRIAGMRDYIAHGYFGLDEKIIWDTATLQVPRLKKDVMEMMADLSGI